ALVAFDVVLHVLGTLTGGTPGGPRSSAYSTGRTGVRAYAELLGRYGHPVERLRTAPSHSRLDPTDTVFLLDPPAVAAQDADALRAFLVEGGRLVSGGRAGTWVRRLVEQPPSGTTVGVIRARPLGSALPGVASQGARAVQACVRRRRCRGHRANGTPRRGRGAGAAACPRDVAAPRGPAARRRRRRVPGRGGQARDPARGRRRSPSARAQRRRRARSRTRTRRNRAGSPAVTDVRERVVREVGKVAVAHE